MQPIDPATNLKLDYQTPAARPKNMAWVYVGRVFLAGVVLAAAGALFAVLWFVTFFVSLGPGPVGP